MWFTHKCSLAAVHLKWEWDLVSGGLQSQTEMVEGPFLFNRCTSLLNLRQVHFSIEDKYILQFETNTLCNLRLRWWKVCSCSIDAQAFGNRARYINLCPVRENSLWQSFLSLLVIDSDLGELLLAFFSPELCLGSIANMVGYDSVWFVITWFNLVCGRFSLGFEFLRWFVGDWHGLHGLLCFCYNHWHCIGLANLVFLFLTVW